ncbi:MAG: hypothetical protein QG622_3613 [Actinomycetota bacterium]|nr:hypothetical protein [Actinomycetota bacterium]
MRLTTRTVAAAAVAVATMAGTTVLAGKALAEEQPPTSMELLMKCRNGADFCEFHAEGGPTVFAGDRHQIGTTLFNCGPGASTKQVTWIDGTSETNSLGVSLITATDTELGFFSVFKTEYEVSYGHKWGTSESTNRTTDVKVDAGQKAWLTRATPMQRIPGKYELHFGSKFHGHYYWYVPFTMTGPAPEAKDVDVVSQHSAPMTAGEKEQCA